MEEKKTFEEFDELINNYRNKIKKYNDLIILPSKNNMRDYNDYYNNHYKYRFISRILPKYINYFKDNQYNEYNYEFFIIKKYDKLDFRFLDEYNNKVKSFIINLILIQNAKNSNLIDMSFMEDLFKILLDDKLEDLLENLLIIIKIIKTNDFLSVKYNKDYDDIDLNNIMLNETIKDNMLNNNLKMEKLFKLCIQDNDYNNNLELKYDIKINFIFEDKIIIKYVNSFIFIDNIFIISYEQYNKSKEFNFNFELTKYNENLIIELIRYLYIGTINFENLNEEDIINLYTFGDEKLLNLKNICERYLELKNKIITFNYNLVSINQIKSDKINSLYLYIINQNSIFYNDIGFYVITYKNKLYYLCNYYDHININDQINKYLLDDIYTKISTKLLPYFKKYKINYNPEIIKQILNEIL